MHERKGKTMNETTRQTIASAAEVAQKLLQQIRSLPRCAGFQSTAAENDEYVDLVDDATKAAMRAGKALQVLGYLLDEFDDQGVDCDERGKGKP